MEMMNKVKTEMRNLADEYFNDSKAVKLVEELIDEEYTNAENISVLLDRIEDLEDQVESLKENK